MGSQIPFNLAVPAGSSATGAVEGLQNEPAEARTSRASNIKSSVPDASKREGPKASAEIAKILGVRDSSEDKLQVSVDETSGVIVRIVDGKGNVVRQIPPDELIALAKRLDEVIGMLFDKKA